MAKMNHIKAVVAGMAALFCQTGLYAQFAPFAYTYGGSGNDMGYDLVETADSGYVCAGQSGSYTFGSSDAYLFKTDINGQLVWRRNYGGFHTDGARAVTRGHGGGFLLAGYTNSFGNGGYDYYVIRTDETGDTLWTRTYGGADWDFAYSVCATADGNYLVAGETFSQGQGGSDIWVLKINDNGDTLHTYLWGAAGNQTCRKVREYAPGRAVVAGNGAFPFSDGQDAVLLGIDHVAQNYLFQTVVPYVGDQEITAVDRSVTGGFATFGIHTETGHSKDLFIQYYQADGTLLQNIELPSANEAFDVEIHAGINYGNQGYYVAGSSRTVGGGDYEALFFQLHPDPYVILGRVITAPRYNGLWSILRAVDKGIVMGGISEGFGPGPSGALVWKLDSLCTAGPYPVPLLGVEALETLPGFSVYPNPFTESFLLSVPESVQLSEICIRDMGGRIIYRQRVQGTGQVTVSPGMVAQGIYTAECVLASGKRYYTKLVKAP